MRNRLHPLCLMAIILSIVSPASAISASNQCEPRIAEIVSVQGRVEAQRAGEVQWQPARLNDVLCPGDTIRVQDRSRAALVLINETVLRLDQNTTVTFPEPEERGVSLLDLLTGTIHFFSRVPRALKVRTPFVNAAVEGTEFSITVRKDQATVTVFEGEVAAGNEQGRLILRSGDSGMAQVGQAPTLRVVARPRDAVRWALHYPTIVDYRPADFTDTDWQRMVRRSIEFYRAGDLVNAFSAIAKAPEEIRDPRFFTYRAALLLTVGRVHEANADITQALTLAPNNSHAFALQAIIAAVQNEKANALELAMKAVAFDAESAVARVALSYAQQANFDLPGALASLQEAVSRDPENALAWARLSELWLSVGDLDEALAAASEAVSRNPDLARAQTVLGFAYLTQIKIQDAKEAFEKAIELDQAAPLPRLGLGLAKIRRSDLEAGRREIEIAASLDPSNSLIRSYLGKAYFEEKRDKLAAAQYTTAKELDPLDPTPWFYDAIRKQTINRPVEALRDLQKSIELNDNRAVYRSRLLLDQDFAARSVSLGRIYSDLGFQQLALVEGWKSVNIDPANYSAHRLLADSYAALSRHEIARVSELLQAQLLQPINANPLQPQLAESNLAILEGAGPSDLAFNEFNPLFIRNGPRFQANGVVASNDTWGDDLVFAGIRDRVSYSVGQFHYETDGFRKNNDLDDDIYNLFAQVAITPRFNLQAEARKRETEQGDLDLNFDPNDFSPDARRDVSQDTARIGAHFAPSPQSDVIVSLIDSDREGEQKLFAAAGPDTDERTDTQGNQLEVQYLFRRDRFNITAGLGTYDIDVDRRTLLDWTSVFGVSCPPSPPFPPVPCEQELDFTRKHDTAYVYANINFPKALTWTFGLSYDSLEQRAQDLDESNPKAGLQWNVTDDIRLRLGYTETVKRALIVNQTIEPTQVAGFNQFFDDVNGTEAKRSGVGVDATLTDSILGGVEVSQRDLEVPRFTPTTVTFADRSEDLYRTYLYWTPHPRWAVSAEYQFEKVRSEPPDLTKVETTSVPVAIRYFSRGGVFAEFGATFVRQEVDLIPTPSFDETREDFVIVDVAVGYRLPKRRGIISLEVRNLLDEEFLFQDVNFITSEPVTPPFVPERVILGRFTLIF